jgi:molybdate transport system substrate-binding protein
MRRPFRRSLTTALALVVLVGVAACGDDSGSASSSTTSTTTAQPKATGDLTVFAAASLTEAFTDLQTSLKTSDPDLALTYSFGGSGTLVTQVQQGAPADVVATADKASMQKLVDAGLVEQPTIFADNKLEILVAPGNPLHITSLQDLARTGVKVVLGDETVPAGRYAAQILGTAGVTVQPVSKETDVKAAVAKVTSGEADATIVYVTDVKAAGSKGTGVVIPDAQNVVAEYPIAIVSATTHHAAAAIFINEVVKGDGQKALEARGFLPAP